MSEYTIIRDIAEIAESVDRRSSKRSLLKSLDDIASIARGYIDQVRQEVERQMRQEYKDKYGEDFPKDFPIKH